MQLSLLSINHLLIMDIGCYLLRNQKSLRLLSGWCRPTTSKGQRLCRIRDVTALDSSAVTLFLTAHGMSLVWVRLSLMSKGKPELHAMVCVPLAEDLKLLSKESNGHSPQEPPHKNHFRRRKKGSKKAAASSLSSDKTEGSGSNIPPATESDLTPSAEGPKSTSQPSTAVTFGLWPDPLPSITSHCSRVTLGWVTQGDFSLSAGCGEALGFVSVTGLLNTLLNQPKEHRGTLLLRNPTSLHYRFAKINIEV